MSSKTQLNDYNKNLKKEIALLKKEVNKLNNEISGLRLLLESTERRLKIAQKNKRKWYHFI